MHLTFIIYLIIFVVRTSPVALLDLVVAVTIIINIIIIIIIIIIVVVHIRDRYLA